MVDEPPEPEEPPAPQGPPRRRPSVPEGLHAPAGEKQFFVLEEPPEGEEPESGGMKSEAERTLVCKECGALNLPTEWYCDKCGAELSAF